MPNEPASPELISALRDQTFEEIERVADKAASYARSIGEAAFRGDEVTLMTHLRQLRECVLAMIATQKELQRVSPGSAHEQAGKAKGDRPDQRSGDGVA